MSICPCINHIQNFNTIDTFIILGMKMSLEVTQILVPFINYTHGNSSQYGHGYALYKGYFRKTIWPLIIKKFN